MQAPPSNSAKWFFVCALPLFAAGAVAQRADVPAPSADVALLPDAPLPQFSVRAASEQTDRSDALYLAAVDSDSGTPLSEEQSSQTSSSNADQPTQQSQEEKAEQQIKAQEKQRVLGILPSFNVSYLADAAPLTAKQKIKLAFRSAVDPVQFGTALFSAGNHELFNDQVGFDWGLKGLGERAGVAYLDQFDGTMIGNGLLPAVFHQDPRYFRLGHGTIKHRLLYALFTNIACHHDGKKSWEPNYSNVGGNIVSGMLATLYYPKGNGTISLAVTTGLAVTAEGGGGSLFTEFWPDISRHFFHKDPTHGLDAEAQRKDAAEKAVAQQPKQLQSAPQQ